MTTKRKIIEVGWNKYLHKVIPANASAVQIEETRRGFYAGAWCVLSGVTEGLSDGKEATDADEQLLIDVHDEIMTFIASVRGDTSDG